MLLGRVGHSVLDHICFHRFDLNRWYNKTQVHIDHHTYRPKVSHWNQMYQQDKGFLCQCIYHKGFRRQCIYHSLPLFPHQDNNVEACTLSLDLLFLLRGMDPQCLLHSNLDEPLNVSNFVLDKNMLQGVFQGIHILVGNYPRYHHRLCYFRVHIDIQHRLYLFYKNTQPGIQNFLRRLQNLHLQKNQQKFLNRHRHCRLWLVY